MTVTFSGKAGNEVERLKSTLAEMRSPYEIKICTMLFEKKLLNYRPVTGAAQFETAPAPFTPIA
jgi:hypothetical protein